jgi:polysaccharide export outer membrane protein
MAGGDALKTSSAFCNARTINIMKTRTLLAGLVTASLCACSLAPGPYLDSARLDQTAQPEVAAPTYPVVPIDIDYFRKVRAAQVVPPCPLTCLDKTSRANYTYRIGINDQLTVIVWDHPELTGGAGLAGGAPPLPQLQGAGGTSAGGGSIGAGGSAGAAAASGGVEGGMVVRVANDGTIFFPRVGRIKVLGKTAEQVQQQLTQALSKTIRNPQLDVRVSGFNSQSVQVTGNVRTPEAESITDLPLTILGTRHTIDVAALLETGEKQQNVLLEDGDIIDVPDRSNSRVFVLGEVGKPTSLPMNRGRLTLADAITGAGSLEVKSADPRLIYVIRGMVPTGTDKVAAEKALNPEIFRLDMTQVDAVLLMTKFELQPKDVVYVQVANSARFNRLLDTISPALNTLFFYKELN